jgi:hypothetical protein
MAIKSIKDLPGKNRPGSRQIEAGKKAKPIEKKGRIAKKTRGKIYYDLGVVKNADVPGVIKGFRQKFKVNFGTLLMDTKGNVIARSHVAKGTSTIPEQLAVKLLSKYGKNYDEVRVMLVIPDKKKKGAVKKSTAKKTTKKPLKKSLKTMKTPKKSLKKISTMKKTSKISKATKKSMKKTTKKAIKKK